jgi:hypothetical protein
MTNDDDGDGDGEAVSELNERMSRVTEVLGENLPSAALSIADLTWLDQGSNQGRRVWKSASNRTIILQYT